jgi:hypothetical protein
LRWDLTMWSSRNNKLHSSSCARRRTRAFALVLLCVIGLLSGTRAQDVQPSAGQLLQAASRAVNWGDRYSSIINVKSRITFGPQHEMLGKDAVVHKYVDGDQLHIIQELSGHVTHGAFVAAPFRIQVVVAQGIRTSWAYSPAKPQNGGVQVARSPERVSRMRLVDESDCSAGFFLDGDVDGMGNIVDIVRSGKVSPEVRHEQVMGIDCDVIESQLSPGSASLWIAPSKGNTIIKFVLQTNHSGEPMDAQFQAANLQNMGDRISVTSGSYIGDMTDPDTHETYHSTVQAQRTELILHPDLAGPDLFTTHTVPNGLRVHLDDKPNIGVNLVWYDGQPIAKIDPDLFTELDLSVLKTMVGKVSQAMPIADSSAADATSVLAAHRMKRMWLVLFGLAGIGLIGLLCLCLRRYRTHEYQDVR